MDSETLRLSGLLPQNKKIYQRKSGKGISSFNVLDVLMVSAFLAFRDWENMIKHGTIFERIRSKWLITHSP